MNKEQRKLKKRKVKEEQNKKNLLFKRKISQQLKKAESQNFLKNRAEEKYENKKDAQHLREIKEQETLRSKIDSAYESYKKVENELTDEQKSQVLTNISYLETVLEEYEKNKESRIKINEELESKGAFTIEEKLNTVAGINFEENN